MPQRITPDELYKLCPRIPKHLLGLSQANPNSSVTHIIRHLVKLRISQINHCCYCQHMHSDDARQDGERQVRLDVLPAWREAPCFTSRERIALAWAEALTLISNHSVPAEIYEEAVAEFGIAELLELTTVVLEINAWNRLAVSLQFTPEINLAMERTN